MFPLLDASLAFLPHSSAVVLFSSSTKRTAKKNCERIFQSVFVESSLLISNFSQLASAAASSFSSENRYFSYSLMRGIELHNFFLSSDSKNFRITMGKCGIRDENFTLYEKTSFLPTRRKKNVEEKLKSCEKLEKKSFWEKKNISRISIKIELNQSTLKTQLTHYSMNFTNFSCQNIPQTKTTHQKNKAAAVENTTSTRLCRLTTDSYYQRIVSLTNFFFVFSLVALQFSLTIACMTWCCLLSSLVAPRPRFCCCSSAEWNETKAHLLRLSTKVELQHIFQCSVALSQSVRSFYGGKYENSTSCRHILSLSLSLKIFRPHVELNPRVCMRVRATTKTQFFFFNFSFYSTDMMILKRLESPRPCCSVKFFSLFLSFLSLLSFLLSFARLLLHNIFRFHTSQFTRRTHFFFGGLRGRMTEKFSHNNEKFSTLLLVLVSW